MKNCHDEPYADKFVKDCQKMCDSIYENGKEFTEEMENELQETIYRAMLYKVGKIYHALGKCCCVTKFQGRGPYFGEKAYKKAKMYIYAVLVINLIIQVAMTTMDQRF